MEEKIAQALNSIGLTNQESEIYIGLLKKPLSTANDLSQFLGKHRSNVYDTLKMLEKKGFILESIQENKRLFKAKEPKFLLSYLSQRFSDLKQIIPQLNDLKNVSNKREIISISHGIVNIKEALNKIFSLNSEIFIWSFIKNIDEMLGGFLYEKIKERITRYRPTKILLSEECTLRSKIRYLNIAEIKIKKISNQDVFCAIGDDEVFIIAPLESITLINLKNKEISGFFRTIFLSCWYETY